MQLHGIFPALVTPMTATGEVDTRKLAAFVDHLIAQGVHGITPLGSTGEFYALSPEERTRVLKTVFDAAAGRVPIVPGTNAGSTRDVVAFSRQAEKMGAAGVLLGAPYYSLPTPDELFAHFKAVNNAIGIPIMLYNYPGRTGVDMTPDFVVRLTSLKNVRYIKESTGEMPRIAMLQRLCRGRLSVFCGCDTIALQSFVVGAAGWVGGVVNVTPRCHAQLYERAVVHKDFAAAGKLFSKMLPLLELMEGGGKYTQWVKAACALAGHNCGHPRGPLAPATRPEIAKLQAALRLCAAEEHG